MNNGLLQYFYILSLPFGHDRARPHAGGPCPHSPEFLQSPADSHDNYPPDLDIAQMFNCVMESQT